MTFPPILVPFIYFELMFLSSPILFSTTEGVGCTSMSGAGYKFSHQTGAVSVSYLLVLSGSNAAVEIIIYLQRFSFTYCTNQNKFPMTSFILRSIGRRYFPDLCVQHSGSSPQLCLIMHEYVWSNLAYLVTA